MFTIKSANAIWFLVLFMMLNLCCSQVLYAQSSAERFERMFASAEIITEQVSAPNQEGIYYRTRLVKTYNNTKTEWVRLEAVIKKDIFTGREEFLEYTAEIADEVMVELKPGISASILVQLLERYQSGAYRVTTEKLLPGYVIKILNPDINALPKLIRFLTALPEVNIAESNPFVLPNAIYPNDPLYNLQQWGLKKIRMPEAWEISTGSKAVVVAVIDSGVDYTRPELKDNIWKNSDEIPNNGKDDDKNGFIDDDKGWDFADDDNTPRDENFHGTGVASVISAKSNNGIGMAGVSWQISIMPIKTRTLKDTIKGYNYAMQNGAHIINKSSTLPHRKKLLNAVLELQKAGILLVAAAGNAGEENKGKSTSWEFPASYNSLDNVISVGGSDNFDALNNSNYSKTYVDIVAPVSTPVVLPEKFDEDFGGGTGTSLSAPLVAGVAALLKAMHPEWKAKELKKAIVTTVDPVYALKNKIKYGGRLNAYCALLSANPGRIILNVPTKIIDEYKTDQLIKIPLDRVDGNDGKIVVKVVSLSGSATNQLDYQAVETTVVWESGEIGKRYLTFKLKDDQLVEGNENVYVDLEIEGGATWKFGDFDGSTQAQLKIIIIDDELNKPGMVRFKKTFYLVDESVGQVNVEVERVGGTSGPLTVDYKLYSLVQKKGDPNGGVSQDFVAPYKGKLSWKAGESGVKTFFVKVINDNVKEGEESFRLLLKSFNGSQLSTPYKIPFIIKASDTVLPLK